jgi:gluconate 5-dehydrogenase
MADETRPSQTPDPASYLSGLFGLQGEVAIVTGAADGLGRAIALGLARSGATVLASDRDRDRLQVLQSELDALGGQHRTVPCDIGVVDEIAAMYEFLDRTYDRLSILVNNAGVLELLSPPEDYPLTAWESTLRVNLTGTMVSSQEAGRRMIASGQGGSIVNLSSIGGVTALAGGSFAYDITKCAINQLTRELAVEWARYGVRVNSIAPCHFRTRGWAEVVDDPAYRETVNAVLRGIPIGRMGEADEVVGPVLFLCSPAASMVSGVVLPVDGANLALNAAAGGVLENRK